MRVIRVNLREDRNLRLPLNREEDQTVVNFRDVLQAKMALGLKSSEGNGRSFCFARCKRGDPAPNEVDQIFPETEKEFVSVMALGGIVRLPDGMVQDLPWRALPFWPTAYAGL